MTTVLVSIMNAVVALAFAPLTIAREVTEHPKARRPSGVPGTSSGFSWR